MGYMEVDAEEIKQDNEMVESLIGKVIVNAYRVKASDDCTLALLLSDGQQYQLYADERWPYVHIERHGNA